MSLSPRSICTQNSVFLTQRKRERDGLGSIRTEAVMLEPLQKRDQPLRVVIRLLTPSQPPRLANIQIRFNAPQNKKNHQFPSCGDSQQWNVTKYGYSNTVLKYNLKFLYFVTFTLVQFRLIYCTLNSIFSYQLLLFLKQNQMNY